MLSLEDLAATKSWTTSAAHLKPRECPRFTPHKSWTSPRSLRTLERGNRGALYRTLDKT